MTKTVEKAIKRIAKRVEKETTVYIDDYLEDCVSIYEVTEDGKKASSEYIIKGLENEANKYIDYCRDNP